MSNSNHKILFFLISLFFCFQAKAQVNDAGLWLNLNVEKKVTQKFSAQFTHGFRWYENISELGTSFSEIGMSYKIIKPLTVAGFYRYSKNKRVDDFYSNSHRYSFYVSYKLKVKQFKINFREQFQSRYKDLGTREMSYIPKKHLRSKIEVSYDLEKKYTPFISGELFYEIGEYIDNVRYQAGLESELNKFNTFHLYYMIDKEMNVKNPWTNYVVGVGYNFTF
ncbi:MAG: DUF2490 domain-containing protein [Bacteroidetes bacterium]|nr:DUF2490 domain-containing protein [Bacteroidota bacterium]